MCWYCWHQASFAICLLSPSLCPPPPLSPNQSALHLLSLRACHPYGISEAGTRHPLPLSLLLLFTPPFPRPLHQFSKGSRWHLAPLSSLSQCWKQGRAINRTTTKKPWKRGYTPFHVLLGACCVSCAHRLGAGLLLFLLLISMLLAPPGWLLQFELKT